MPRGKRVDKVESEKRVSLSITGPYKPANEKAYYQWIMLSEEIKFKVHGDGKHPTKIEAVKDAELVSELLGLYIGRVIGA